LAGPVSVRVLAAAAMMAQARRTCSDTVMSGGAPSASRRASIT
jgi:hypothetical protein